MQKSALAPSKYSSRIKWIKVLEVRYYENVKRRDRNCEIPGKWKSIRWLDLQRHFLCHESVHCNGIESCRRCYTRRYLKDSDYLAMARVTRISNQAKYRARVYRRISNSIADILFAPWRERELNGENCFCRGEVAWKLKVRFDSRGIVPIVLLIRAVLTGERFGWMPEIGREGGRVGIIFPFFLSFLPRETLTIVALDLTA